MAFCPNCGASVEGRFCAKCGASVPAASGSNAGAAPSGYGDPQGAQQGYGQSQYNQAPTASGLTDNVAGALCYVLGLITGIVFLVLAPYNQRKFVRFHAFQSIFFHVAFIVVMIAEMVIGAILPWWISSLLWTVISLCALVVWIFLLVKAYQGEMFKLPVVGDMAEKQA